MHMQQRKEHPHDSAADEAPSLSDGAPLLNGWPRGSSATSGSGGSSPRNQLGWATWAWRTVAAVAVLAGLAWGIRQLATQREQEVSRWMEYVPAQRPAAAAHTAVPRPQQQCRLPLDGSPWERHCQRLRRVCFDQGQMVLYDDRCACACVAGCTASQ